MAAECPDNGEAAMDDLTADAPAPVWLDADAGCFETFRAQLDRTTQSGDVPHAAHIAGNVPVYDGDAVRAAAADPQARQALMAEWVQVFDSGPGVIVIRRALADAAVVDRATEVFETLIARERAEGGGAGDHFARPGANDRVWNAVQKHCMADPANFARYYGAEAIALPCTAWLGRGYQVTAQVNRVNPGGAAQTAHRDYHLGFMSPGQMRAFPAHVHRISPLLTLQGAVAHCDMPVESGPTMLLPYSQRFFEGYIAFGRPEFQAYFAQHHVQLPLAKGDAVFFNPALMHGAGHNRTRDVHRMANLLQVSSAFGRAMEAVDRDAMCAALYPALREGRGSGALSRAEALNAIAACAEGYAFPTNLDSDPPVGGLAPKTQAEHMAEAREAGLSEDDFGAALVALAARRRP
jgi:ectoine hydroxylase-related dioxygenase (phytanoyl-CoA dioxygenase family)